MDGRPLSRDRVVRSALGLVDESGLGALTMRALGQRLGVEAMSVYHHVNGREDLLEAMIDHLAGELRAEAADATGPLDGWQAFLQRKAHDVRRMALAHPRLFPLIATRPPAAPWLRPPLRSLDVVEEFLSGLIERGLSDARSVQVYKTFTSFLLGHLLLEVAELGADTGPPDEPLDEGDAEVPNRQQQVSLDRFPTVLRLEGRLRRHDADEEFEAALEALLTHLDRELSQ
jgi:AcrR family transcriptional regulator